MNPATDKPAPERDRRTDAPPAGDDEPGTNAVEHEPDPNAQPLPDGHHKYVPRSPFTAGNT